MLEWLTGLSGFLLNTHILSEYGGRLLDGLRMTLMVVGISCGLGFLLAYPVCLARMSRNTVLSSVTLGYTTLFRGTPLLCQLYLIYYGAGQIRPELQAIGLWWFFKDAFYCCLFTFTLNTCAYQAEIMRGALQSVPRGQRETALALGLSGFATARLVVWPQALLVALRPLGNELISMVKVSALSAIVTLLDLMGQTRFVFARTFDFSIYLYAAVLYLLITEGVRRLWAVIERHLSRHLQTDPAAAMQVGAAAAPGAPIPEAPLTDVVSSH